jgi:rare lipoprotein A
LSPSLASAEPNKEAGKVIQSGRASWYGPGFHGRRTASGETFNTNELTAAHRTLPFGTRVKVVNKKTGKSVVVRINDRGPYAHGRVIDLSRASAQAIGISGVAAVDVAQL